MYRKIKNYVSSKDFVKDNLILFIASFIMNILGYLYHFSMGRTLGPVQYGILGSLFSIIYIITIPINTIQTTIANFTARFKVNNEKDKINYLIRSSLKKISIYSLIVIIIAVMITPFIQDFLHITNKYYLYLVYIFFIFAMIIPISRGVFQGLQNFKQLGLSMILEGFFKLFPALILVYLGFGIVGAIVAVIISYLIPILVSTFQLKEILKTEKKKFESKEVYKYTVPVMLMLLFTTLYYSMDILLVKHFFSEHDAGYYAAISLLGKIIFFGSLSIVMVMFPKVSENYYNKKPHKRILYKSLGAVALFGFVVSLFYFLFSDLTVKVVFGNEYAPIAGLIGIFGLMTTFISLSYLIAYYNISINKIRFLIILFVFDILEILLIWFFHNSLATVIYILLFMMITLFIILFTLFYISKERYHKTTIKNY
ncbi:MAG TPA: oligosaccharide flippase family protein [Candidatus Nanoarchaeia archaeon]|nr:oligosaccharide flippase family protein [Candidatus Nanoarchaeia archaeon]